MTQAATAIAPNDIAPPCLEVRDLTLTISGAKVIRNVSFNVGKAEIVAIVGESGCGKSLTSLAIMGLNAPNVVHESGRILFHGVDATHASPRERIEKLGVRNAMIFQEPIASLNPLLTVGSQIEEAYRTHAKSEGRKVDAAEARKVALAAMERVRITDVERRHGQFPFELSGGMCQRIMIASALVTDPDLLIADEPTTALDATIQLQVLNLIRELRSSLSMSVIIVTHDLGVVADVADRVVVMYAGAVVETGSVDEIFARPRHPYTRKLLDVVTAMDVGRPKATLPTIEGTVLSPFQDIGGCRFQPRCDRAIETCLTQVPPLVPTDGASGHSCACWATNAPAKAKVPA